jgi:hypothetical protein
MEMARIMEFLLQEEVPIDGNPGVLPIVGPRRIGKSTQIEYACKFCNHERVRVTTSLRSCVSENVVQEMREQWQL